MSEVSELPNWWPAYFPERWHAEFELPDPLTTWSEDASTAFCGWEAVPGVCGLQHNRDRELFCEANGLSEDDLEHPLASELLSDADKIRFCEIWYPFQEEQWRYPRGGGYEDKDFKWAVPICLVGDEVPLRWPYDAALQMALWHLCATCRTERLEWLVSQLQGRTALQKIGRWFFGS
jgi:hypothetical protein